MIPKKLLDKQIPSRYSCLVYSASHPRRSSSGNVQTRLLRRGRLFGTCQRSNPLYGSRIHLQDVLTSFTAKSLPHNPFADPHPLNLYASIFYKNSGGRGRYPQLASIFRTLFQVPYPASPLFAALTKTGGVWGYSFHYGTHLTLPGDRNVPAFKRPTSQRFFVYPHSFHTLAYSFAHSKNSTLLFSGDCALFAKKPPGVGESASC
jgi:hypothetical protein